MSCSRTSLYSSKQAGESQTRGFLLAKNWVADFGKLVDMAVSESARALGVVRTRIFCGRSLPQFETGWIDDILAS